MSTKIYTKTGDRGETGLLGGDRVAKNNPRIQAYGDIDELNSQIGRLICEVQDKTLTTQLQHIQHRLFNIGSLFSSPTNSLPNLPNFSPDWVDELESWMDQWDTQLPPLKAFILPGGHPSAATAHIARTVCRRAERNSVPLIENSALELPFIFINRLSDYLFVVARICNFLNKVADVEWQK